MAGYLRKLLVCGMLSASALLAQTSHRQPEPKPPSQPNPFEQLEEQASQSQRQDRTRQAAAREQRKVNRAELNRELPQLIELAQNLQKQLNATNLETAVPADIERQAKQLEQAARQIHKRIRGL